MSEHNYLIISAGELEKVDFDQLLITSPATLIFSNDRSKTFIEWDNTKPNFLNELNWSDGPYTQSEMIEILATDMWAKRDERMNEQNEQQS